jgi:hypothetical protein
LAKAAGCAGDRESKRVSFGPADIDFYAGERRLSPGLAFFCLTLCLTDRLTLWIML